MPFDATINTRTKVRCRWVICNPFFISRSRTIYDDLVPSTKRKFLFDDSVCKRWYTNKQVLLQVHPILAIEQNQVIPAKMYFDLCGWYFILSGERWKTSRKISLPKRRSGCVNALYITMRVISFSKCRFVPRAIKDRPAVENSRRDFTPGWVIMRVRHRRTHLLYPAANSTIVESSRIPRWAT